MKMGTLLLSLMLLTAGSSAFAKGDKKPEVSHEDRVMLRESSVKKHKVKPPKEITDAEVEGYLKSIESMGDKDRASKLQELYKMQDEYTARIRAKNEQVDKEIFELYKNEKKSTTEERRALFQKLSKKRRESMDYDRDQRKQLKEKEENLIGKKIRFIDDRIRY